MSKLIPVFKTGIHKDSKGNTKSWTVKELDAIAGKYNNQNPDNFHEAPIVIGHPKSNAPAWGWIDSLKRIGEVLYAKPKKLVNEFSEWVKEGRYKKRSISLYPDLTLRHIGFLGAMPPAVKGLPDTEFAENEEEITIEFDEGNYYIQNKFVSIADMFSKLRDFFIEKEGLEKADLLIPDWKIQDVQKELPRPEEAIKNYSDIINIDGLDKSSLEDNNLTNEGEGMSKEFEEKMKNLEAENTKLKNEMLAKEKVNKRLSYQSFCESDEIKKKITPAMKNRVIDFMEIIESTGEYEFAEEAGKVKKNAVDEFKTLIKALPDQISFGETATGKAAGEQDEDDEGDEFADATVDENSAALDKKVKALMKKDKTLTYKDALAQCMKDGGK